MEFGENFVNEDGVVYNPNQSQEALDPNNINYDEEGNVESIYDPETGKTFKEKVVVPEETPEEKAARIEAGNETEEEKAERIAAGNETPEEKEAREKLENETPEEKEAREKAEKDKAEEGKYHNGAHYVLKLSGYDNEEIELESGRKKIADLTPEEQNSIIIQEYDNLLASQEETVAEAKKTAQEGFFQNEGEKELIGYLREKGDPVELAKYILDNSPSLVADMSNEEAVTKQLRDDFPEYTNDEINEEIELLKTNGKLERRAELVKTKYKDKDLDISDLNKKLGLKTSENLVTQQADHQKKMDDFVEYAKAEKTVAGVPMSEEVRDYLLSGIVTEKPNGETNFLKSLSDPKKLMRLNFLDTYFEKILEATKKESYAKGKKVGDNLIKKFSDTPVKLGGTKKKEEKIAQPKSVNDVDVDKMVEEAEKVF